MRLLQLKNLTLLGVRALGLGSVATKMTMERLSKKLLRRNWAQPEAEIAHSLEASYSSRIIALI